MSIINTQTSLQDFPLYKDIDLKNTIMYTNLHINYA